MKILIVCSGNAKDFDFAKHQAFIYDQVKAVNERDATIEFSYFFIRRKGARGYLQCLTELRKRLTEEPFDWVHAHFATSALLANLQRKVPVITTFHGSDINLKMHRLMSAVVEVLSKRTVYVSEELRQNAFISLKSKNTVIPCGVDFGLFVPGSKREARQALGFSNGKKYILFSSSFENPVKNFPLARTAVALLADDQIEVLELKGYTREEVVRLMSAVDVALMTSFTEGSPQFVKEALACNCPVICTDVGDVKSVLSGIEGCYLTTFEPRDVAEKITRVLSTTKPVLGRKHIGQFDNRLIADKLIKLYNWEKP